MCYWSNYFCYIGFLFKISAAPFHNWAPDVVYDGVPTIVTTWLTIMPKLSSHLILLLEVQAGAVSVIAEDCHTVRIARTVVYQRCCR